MAATFVAFDLETTGLSAKADRIIEVGAVRFDITGTVLDQLELIVDPGMPIPLAIQRLVGITDHDVAGSPSPTEAVAQLADFIADSAVVAHGAEFDLAYCAAVTPDVFRGKTVYDTLELARVLLPMETSHSLPQLTVSLTIEHSRPHRALSDADATRMLFTHLVGVAGALPGGTLGDLRRVFSGQSTSFADFLESVVTSAGDAGAATIRGVPTLMPRRAEPIDVGDVATAAAKLLGPDGGLANAAEYEYREPQLQMTAAVAQTLQRSGHLLVEAGTGVGKSFAYLAPLLLHSLATGKRGVVATYTIALQEQLVENDVATLQPLLPAPARVAILKGRKHYVSLRRWQRFLAGPTESVEAARFKAKILVWLAVTSTGDRAELRLSSTEEALWRNVESDTADCLGSACANWRSGGCYMVAARRAAANADVVVTNHSLLLADAERQGVVLDSFGSLVIDEAHRLEEAATRQMGATLRNTDVIDIAERLSAQTPAQQAQLDGVVDIAKRLFGDAKGFIAEQLGHDVPSNGTLAWTPQAREVPAAQQLSRVAARTVSELLRVADDIDTTLPVHGENTADREELSLISGALRDGANIITAVFEPPQGYVSWLELRAEQAEFHLAPIDVAEATNERVFDKVESLVLTSATLSVAGSFGFIQSRLGLPSAQTLSLPSPFDYLEQAISVIPTDMPPYDDPAYDDAMAGLVGDIAQALGGRTLALFTGYSALRRIHAILDNRLRTAGIAVLGQGLDGTRRQVLHSFLADPRSVLLGTASFWEGIDIPGDAVQCVIIAKLPFAVPTDPLVRARCDAVASPFADYILPQAVLRLKQGFGRLVRRSTDHGAVVIGDARLENRDYAQAFLSALPPVSVARTRNQDVAATVERFIASGALPEAAMASFVPNHRQFHEEDLGHPSEEPA